MGTTPSYGWSYPDPTDLVKDLPADFELFADAVDADLADLLGGATGQVLSKASASDHDFSWIYSAGFTPLATGTLTGTTVNITSIPTDYKDLVLVVRQYRPVTDNAALRMRFNGDTNTRYRFSSQTSFSGAFNDDYIQIASNQDNTAATGLSYCSIYDYANTTTWKMAEIFALGVNGTTPTEAVAQKVHGIYNQTPAITEINLFNSSGNFTSGTYFLYGV